MGYRAMVVRQMKSGLPEDRIVNTFHFYDTDSTAPRPMSEVADDIQGQLDFFFNTVHTGATNNMTYWLAGGAFSLGVENHKILIYDLREAKPRTPTERTLPHAALPSGTVKPLPFEVAVNVSLQTPAKGPRGRGRFYFGPLRDSASTWDNTSGLLSVSSALRTDVAAACNALAGDTLSPMVWGVLSPTTGAINRVVSGWVDDAFDTQRRRGTEATTRNSWGPIPTDQRPNIHELPPAA